MKYLITSFIILITIQNICSQQISSPDSKLTLTIKLSDKNELIYNLIREGKVVLNDSKLGIDLLNQPDFLSDFKIDAVVTSNYFEEWSPVLGEVDKIVNNYTQMQITLIQPKEKRKMIITFRLFNDGLGFRYEFPLQDNLNYFIVQEEYSQFALTGNHKTFWIPGDYDSQEYAYTMSLLSEINSGKGNNVNEIGVKSIPGDNFVQTPLMMKSNDSLYINIHEAALLNYPAMYLKVDRDNFMLQSHLCPDTYDNKAYMQTPCSTPWRTIIVSDKAEEILSSKIILNLNEPSKFEDVSWIKPLKYIGIWWGMHVYLVGNARWDNVMELFRYQQCKT